MADITFIKRLDPKIVLPHICQILRLMNKTPPQSIMFTGLEHVVGLRNAPFNSPELYIERRTFASSALPIGLLYYHNNNPSPKSQVHVTLILITEATNATKQYHRKPYEQKCDLAQYILLLLIYYIFFLYITSSSYILHKKCSQNQIILCRAHPTI